MTDATKYGPWAIVAGASDGVGEEFALALAQRQINVVLLARRQDKLDEVSQRIRASSGVQARTLSVDLATPGAMALIADATADLEIGFLVYCAGADTDYTSFLGNSIDAADAMVQRNCSAPRRCGRNSNRKAFAGLPKGPTIYAGKQMRRAGRFIHPIPRSLLVRIATKASAKAMGPA